MQLNLPILHLIENSQKILLAGAGGGFDIYAGLPIYFTLRDMGKEVYLANYSMTDPFLASKFTETYVEIPDLLMAAKGEMRADMYYYTEGYLTDWLAKNTDEDPTVWMFPNSGVKQLEQAYQRLLEKFQFDTLILVDGGVDSLARGHEQGPGTFLEDTITLLAVERLDIPTKVLACIGFGTEVEEHLDHYAALENIANLAKAGGFYGTCSLTPQMPAFQKYEAACRHAWEGENRSKSHISTRIIPAAYGEFGNYHMYPEQHRNIPIFVSPLMSMYWFFDSDTVIQQSIAADILRETITKDDARTKIMMWLANHHPARKRRVIPY